MFVDPGGGEAGTGRGRDSAVSECGFEQVDVVHLFGLVCPDFPEELIARVRVPPNRDKGWGTAVVLLTVQGTAYPPAKHFWHICNQRFLHEH